MPNGGGGWIRSTPDWLTHRCPECGAHLVLVVGSGDVAGRNHVECANAAVQGRGIAYSERLLGPGGIAVCDWRGNVDVQGHRVLVAIELPPPTPV